MSENINYSQCWEDPLSLTTALSISPDDTVLSITSGGDNTLAILLKKPKRLISIDFNKTQNYLLELKITASKILDYQKFLEFLGVKKSHERLDLFKKIKNSLSTESKLWWETRPFLIKRGVIHVGRFERFLNSFQRLLLPLIHSRNTIAKFLDITDLNEQKIFYKNSWDTKRWRFLFKIFSSQPILKIFARQRGAFRYTNAPSVGNIYFERFKNNFQTIPIKDNYFMHYCLKGHYNLTSLPPYLGEQGYSFIRNNQLPLDIITIGILNYLKSIPDNYFSKFNLSDIFEFLSEEENNNLWSEIVRTAKCDATIVYWNNLVSRSYPNYLSRNIFDDREIAGRLNKVDRAFFYGSFHINKIIK